MTKNKIENVMTKIRDTSIIGLLLFIAILGMSVIFNFTVSQLLLKIFLGIALIGFFDCVGWVFIVEPYFNKKNIK
jgi:hypothetical protein